MIRLGAFKNNIIDHILSDEDEKDKMIRLKV